MQATEPSAVDYRAMQLASVTGFSGGSAWTLAGIAASMPLSVIAYSSLCSTLEAACARQLTVAETLALEAAVLLGPLFAVGSSTAAVLPTLLLLLAVPLVIAHVCRVPLLLSAARPRSAERKRKPMLTAMRAMTLLHTMFAILAVDFPSIFPREYAKTESFGTSLMDLGVASFVVSAALAGSHKLLRGRGGARGLCKKALPLLLLGAARLLSVRGLDYQSHASEYGLHWNFFITLALLALLSAPLLQLRGRTLLLVAALLLAAHSCALHYGGLTDYVLTAPRVDLLSANREGLVGSSGMLVLFLLAASLGRALWRCYAQPMAAVRLLAAVAAAAGAAAAAAARWQQPVSRRLANAAYILWALASNAAVLLLSAAAQAWLLQPLRTPLLLAAVNRNQLALFLAANVATGVVNMSMRTLLLAALPAYAVMAAYMALLCLAALLLHSGDVTLKVW